MYNRLCELKLGELLLIAIFASQIAMFTLYTTSTRPSEVLAAVKQFEAESQTKIEINKANIERLSSDATQVLTELSGLQKTISELYRSIILLIQTKTSSTILQTPEGPE